MGAANRTRVLCKSNQASPGPRPFFGLLGLEIPNPSASASLVLGGGRCASSRTQLPCPALEAKLTPTPDSPASSSYLSPFPRVCPAQPSLALTSRRNNRCSCAASSRSLPATRLRVLAERQRRRPRSSGRTYSTSARRCSSATRTWGRWETGHALDRSHPVGFREDPCFKLCPHRRNTPNTCGNPLLLTECPAPLKSDSLRIPSS